MKMIIKVVLTISAILLIILSYVVYEGYKSRVAGRVLIEALTVGIPEFIKIFSVSGSDKIFKKEAFVNSPISSAIIKTGYSIKSENNNIIIKITSGPGFILDKKIIVTKGDDGLWRCNRGSFISSYYIGPCRDHETIPLELVKGM